MGICALINNECPETNDKTKKRFCPNWKVGIPGVDSKVGFTAYPLFTGCQLEILPSYIIAVARDAAHSAAAFNQARDVVLEELKVDMEQQTLVQLATLGLVVIGGAARERRLLDASSDSSSLDHADS